MKLQERVLGYKLRHETKKKNGESIWFYDDLPWNLFTQTSNEKKKYREAWKDLHMVFIDLKSIRQGPQRGFVLVYEEKKKKNDGGFRSDKIQNTFRK